MHEKTFTGASLEYALKHNALTRPELEVVGMVKSSENEGHVNFTVSGCEAWIDLPVYMIEQAEHVGKSACKNHSHPVFKITLKESRDPEAQILAALLAALTPSRSHAGPHLTQAWASSAAHMSPEIQQSAAYGSPLTRGDLEGRGTSSRTYQGPRMSARIAGDFGTGFSGSGGMRAWGCWDSECCDCEAWGPCWPTGDGRVICECAQRVCRPCERCIWPW